MIISRGRSGVRAFFFFKDSDDFLMWTNSFFNELIFNKFVTIVLLLLCFGVRQYRVLAP